MGYLWKHCDHCGGELTHPTLSDALVGSVHCPHCHEEQLLDVYDKRAKVGELLVRLENLEERGQLGEPE